MYMNCIGSVLRNYCMNCNKFYDAEYVFNSDGIPKCSCGGIIKPDVVLYQEGLNQDTLRSSVEAIADADMLIVAGTSLLVEPASSLIRLFNGKYLVILNMGSTPYDYMADLVIHDNLKNIFGKLR